jgi:hypothetical protein
MVLLSSRRGRWVLRRLVAFLRTEEGRKLVAQGRRAATGPQGRKVAKQFANVTRVAVEAASRPENRARVRAAARTVRRRATRAG